MNDRMPILRLDQAHLSLLQRISFFLSCATPQTNICTQYTYVDIFSAAPNPASSNHAKVTSDGSCGVCGGNTYTRPSRPKSQGAPIGARPPGPLNPARVKKPSLPPPERGQNVGPAGGTGNPRKKGKSERISTHGISERK